MVMLYFWIDAICLVSSWRYGDDMTQVDDWPIKRTRQQHFTYQEVKFIEKCFREGWKPAAVARKLECSIRSIHARYNRIRNGE